MKFTKINPVGKRVVLKIYESADKSASGIILNNDSNTSAGKVLGTIIEAGEESRFFTSLGKLVFFRRYSMDELKYVSSEGEQTVTLVDDDEILAIPTVDSN